MSSAANVWRVDTDDLHVRFVGRAMGARDQVLAAVEGAPAPVAWLEQRHDADCREASADGACGRGDALWTARRGLAICVSTADCVPVALAGGGRIAVAHAGWRGIVAGVVPAAVATLSAALGEAPAAWIGPAIGPCCYEVAADVAARVVAASAPEIARPGPRGRPHLDLVAAVERQLGTAGVGRIERLGPCTRCSRQSLASYRRDGKREERNLTFAWLDPRSRVGDRDASVG